MLAPLTIVLIMVTTLKPFLIILMLLMILVVVLLVIVVFRANFLNQIVPFLFKLHTGVCIVIHIGVPFEALSYKLLQTFLDFVHE